MKPKRTHSQWLGKLAEAKFAELATEKGWLVHPVHSGNDFGIDARVELVDKNEVTGVEFLVQIKCREEFSKDRDGSINAGSVKVSTVGYWLAKLSPTLLAAYDHSRRVFYWNWAHRTFPVERFSNALERHQDSLVLTFPQDNKLDSAGLQEIENEAQSIHSTLVIAVNSAWARTHFLRVYRLASDVSDVLLELVCSFAYSSPEQLAISLVPKEGLSEKVVEAFKSAKLRIPDLTEAHTFSVSLISALIDVLKAFSEAGLGAGVDRDHPILSASLAVRQLLGKYYLRMLYGEDRSEAASRIEQSSKRGLRWLRLSIPEYVTSIGAIALLLRDFKRELRKWLFPDIVRRGSANSADFIKDEAAEVLHSVEAWFPGS